MIEISPDVQVNRAAFIEALINEDPEAQCNMQLFGGERVLDAAGKEKRCALGVAAKLFFGFETYKAAEEYDREHYTNDREGLYSELMNILGLEDAGDVWRLNDDGNGHTFADIAHILAGQWAITNA